MKTRVKNYWKSKDDVKIFALIPSVLIGFSEYKDILDFNWMGFRICFEFIKNSQVIKPISNTEIIKDWIKNELIFWIPTFGILLCVFLLPFRMVYGSDKKAIFYAIWHLTVSTFTTAWLTITILEKFYP